MISQKTLHLSTPTKTTKNKMDPSYIHKLVDPQNPNDLCPMPLSCQQRFKKVRACVLQGVAGFDKFEDSVFAGKFVRQMCEGQKDDEGNDISGFFVLVDVAQVFMFHTPEGARDWVKYQRNGNKHMANVLKNVASGHSSVSLLKLIKI